jgi:hypothetical protein
VLEDIWAEKRRNRSMGLKNQDDFGVAQKEGAIFDMKTISIISQVKIITARFGKLSFIELHQDLPALFAFGPT